MLKSFSVYNFKNFDTKIVIDLSKVGEYKFNTDCISEKLINKGVIYGKNSVGKSNLGFALFDIKHSMFTSNFPQQYSDYINVNTSSNVAEFEYVFQIDNDLIEYSYGKFSTKEYQYEKLEVNGELIFYINREDSSLNDLSGLKKNDYLKTLNLEFLDADISYLKYIANNTLITNIPFLMNLMNFIKSMVWLKPSDNFVRGYLVDNLKDGEGITEAIVRLGKVKELEEFLISAGVENVPLTTKIDPEGKETIYFNYETPLLFKNNASGGTKALLSIFYISLGFAKTKFLFIDEFDANYHHLAAINIMKYFIQTKGIQVLVTTHNTDLMSNSILRPDCYFILTKKNFTSIKEATDRELREGHNLEKLYQSGEFSYE